MKAYRFSLATVMRIRTLEERLARERLMSIQRDLRSAQDGYRCAQARLAELQIPKSPATINEVRWTAEQAGRLGDELRARAVTVREAASLRDEARQSWQVARKRSSVIERLDEQGRARWREEIMRDEASELDDLASSRFSRAEVST